VCVGGVCAHVDVRQCVRLCINGSVMRVCYPLGLCVCALMNVCVCVGVCVRVFVFVCGYECMCVSRCQCGRVGVGVCLCV